MAKRTGGFIGQDGINAPDPATGVTGTAGDGQVEVSWTAPSDVGGAAITGYNVVSSGGGTWKTYYDMANTAYDDVSFSTASQSTTPTALTFNGDGTKMYVGDYSSKILYQYSLSSAFDVGTASYDSVSLNVSSYSTWFGDVLFNDDGTELYVLADGNLAVVQYALSSAYDISSAAYSSSFSISGQTSSPQGIAFNSDGSKMFIVDYTNNAVYQYSLSTSYDTSTASYDSISFSVSSQVSQAQGLAFSSDGLKMFVGGNATDTIFEYDLSSAYAISGASYSGNSFSVATQETNPSSFAFNNDGSKLFVVGYTNDAVFQYTAGALNYPTASPVTVTGLTNGTSYTFNVWAINPFGWSSPSDASGSVSPSLPRGYFMGGRNSSNSITNAISYINITTSGMDSSSHGDLAANQGDSTGGCSSDTRGIYGGGSNGSSQTNTIQYFTMSTSGNASDFGDLSFSGYDNTALSNITRGLFAGFVSGSSDLNTIEYITIATAGNASDFGDQTANLSGVGGLASPTRGIFAGGIGSVNTIQYVTLSSTGNAFDFGDLTLGRYRPAGASSNTRGLFAGGFGGGDRNIVDYITIASTGNATDFGDLTQNCQGKTGTSNKILAIIAAGPQPEPQNRIERLTIASTGNATDFGDISSRHKGQMGSCSSAHGGLS